MGFLRTIAIIMLTYYALKYIARLAFPALIKRYMGKMEEKFRNQQGFEKQEDVNIGETVIDKKVNNKTSNKDVGEYVDYEEVD
ncbi:MAG TPA: DUF4834 domain-containing protein [Flavobacteriaceae bacterium]|nr:DUF4834 domain-containing protein [Flavobacteriaceae bacterium]